MRIGVLGTGTVGRTLATKLVARWPDEVPSFLPREWLPHDPGLAAKVRGWAIPAARRA